MLVWLFMITMVIGFGLIIIGFMNWDYKKNKFTKFLYCNNHEIMSGGVLIAGISAIVILIMGIIMCCSYVGVDAKVATNKERYTALEYKATSGACRDDFGLLSKEVIDEIQDWNEDVTYYQNIQNDFWVGIFYPNVFDQFETIDYRIYNTDNLKGD